MPNDQLSLDGEWEFLHVATDRIPGPAEVASIRVPGPWQAQFDSLRMRAGTGIYRKSFELPSAWTPQTLGAERIFVRFGAVFHSARVWINGILVGQNEGGFLPFGFDITDELDVGENEIKVRVDSPTDNPALYPDAPFAEIPFGKQSWYGPLSGIWQSVYLERRVADHIARVKLVPQRRGGLVSGTVHFAEPVRAPSRIEVTLTDPAGNRAGRLGDTVEAGQVFASFALPVAEVVDWSPETPNLYRAEVRLTRLRPVDGDTDHRAFTTDEADPDRIVLDRVLVAFGFRDIETRDGKLYLNDQPLYLRAALDQDYYPDLIATPPSTAFLEDQFRKAKALGLNCVRTHIKAVDPRYYDAADRLGLLVWTELPNGGLSTERSRARKEALLKGIVDRDGNHPSIVIWTIINENWGVDLVHDPEHRAWLRQTYHWLKSYDPTRLVVDNSPIAPSFHIETDIADYHFYSGLPDHRAMWDAFVEDLASRPAWLYSPEGDAVATGSEPLMCSEFGNWGLPDPALLKDEVGREPWWFETGHDWGEGVMYAHGLENRFTDWSLDQVFGTLSAFVTAAQWQQYQALKYQIEAMRRQPTIAGYVITELTDCHWESNGLMDMRRNRRVFHDMFRTINADVVIVPRWTRLSWWVDETARVELAVANGGPERIEAATLEIEVDGAIRRVAAGTIEPASVTPLEPLETALPTAATPRSVELGFRLIDGHGHTIATNQLTLAVHPRRRRTAFEATSVFASDLAIRDRLDRLGFPLAETPDAAAVIVATTVDETLTERVRRGAQLLYLPEIAGSLYPFFPHWQNVRIVERSGTLWRGDWASSFSWLRREGPFSGLPGGPLIDARFDRVIPHLVINGLNRLDFQARVHAGMVVGWIHKPAGLIVERSYGRGRIVVSTLQLLRDEPGADPTATALFEALMRLTLAKSAAPGMMVG